MVHMDAALIEHCLLGNKTQHFQVGYIWPQMWFFILIASLESLNYKNTEVLIQQKRRKTSQSRP